MCRIVDLFIYFYIVNVFLLKQTKGISSSGTSHPPSLRVLALALMCLKSSCVSAKPLAEAISSLLQDPSFAPKRLPKLIVALSDKLVNAFNKIMAQLYTQSLCVMNLEAKKKSQIHFLLLMIAFPLKKKQQCQHNFHLYVQGVAVVVAAE